MQHVPTGVLLLALAVVVVASILGALALYDMRKGHASDEKGEAHAPTTHPCIPASDRVRWKLDAGPADHTQA